MRCFVALWPAPAVLEALAALPRPNVNGVRWSTRDQWHITLRFFGELQPEQLELARTALVAAVGSLRGPVEALGGPATRFLGPALIVWPVEGLTDLARAVQEQTASIGRQVPERRFVGHITIARARQGMNLRPARHLLRPLAMAWPVYSISLVESQLHPAGARYQDVEAFPLGPPGA